MGQQPPPHPDTDALSLDDLSAATGVSPRTIRYYMLNGLLAGPTGSGPAARYPAGHAPRLRAIRSLQDDGRQLAAIRAELDTVSDDDLLAGRWRPNLSSARASPAGQGRLFPDSSPRSEPSAIRTQWERFVLEDGVELHVRRPLSTAANRRVQELLRTADKLRKFMSANGAEEV
ncbi:MAG: MerR family transcriptional regulator [Deltaproteobacteria bacterium]|nr:MerR family transcriptional regulator [Deltaproteobacteria bacterium]